MAESDNGMLLDRHPMVATGDDLAAFFAEVKIHMNRPERRFSHGGSFPFGVSSSVRCSQPLQWNLHSPLLMGPCDSDQNTALILAIKGKRCFQGKI